MSDYKKYLLRSLGVKESKSDEQLQEGLVNTSIKSPLMSPTAIATPVIGVAVRGSSTGGLPSGADRFGDISPSRLGGYEKIPVNPVNSKLVDKTPSNPDINQNDSPIVDDPALEGGVTHNHQMQKNAGEQPQSVTGASTDSDNTLKLKSAMPQSIDIDIAQEAGESAQDQQTSMNSNIKKDVNETFARHKALMKKKLECKSCGCDKPNTTHEVNEEDASVINKYKMSPEKAGLVKLSEAFDRLNSLAGLKPLKEEEGYEVSKKKYFDPKTKTVKDVDWVGKKEKPAANEEYSAPFQRMRGLANLGERRLASNGIWSSPVNEVNYTEDDLGAPTIAVGAPGSDARKAAETVPTEKLQQIKATLDKKSAKGTLNDKEVELLKRANAALKKRGL
jgi:hypothetical protein